MIHARGLTKTYRASGAAVEAVRAIDLDVGDGELVAVLGPNGAGKSTALRMLVTLLTPTAGRAVVAGHDVVAEPAAVRRCIGFIGQGNGAGYYHHVRDELVLQGRAHRMSWRDAGRRADALLDTLNLTPLAKRAAGTLSGGQRRRLDVALGLVHDPPLLFLDEPSTGLDPQHRAHLWEHVLGVRERFGTTVVLTTHYLDEADAMAARVVIIDHGRIIADDRPETLKATHAGDRIDLRLANADGAAAGAPIDASSAVAVVRSAAVAVGIDVDAVDVVVSTSANGDVAVRTHRGSERLPALLRALDLRGVTVTQASVRRPTLDDVFLHLTGRSLREDSLAATPVDPDGAGVAA